MCCDSVQLSKIQLLRKLRTFRRDRRPLSKNQNREASKWRWVAGKFWHFLNLLNYLVIKSNFSHHSLLASPHVVNCYLCLKDFDGKSIFVIFYAIWFDSNFLTFHLTDFFFISRTNEIFMLRIYTNIFNFSHYKGMDRYYVFP